MSIKTRHPKVTHIDRTREHPVLAAVTVLVKDSNGEPYTSWEVEVLWGDNGVERGTQVFRRIPHGPELSATVMRRAGGLSDAWDAARAAAGAPEPKRRNGATIHAESEQRAVSQWVGTAAARGKRLTGWELATRLTNLRGSYVSPRMARTRKHEARERGWLPPSDNGTRPSI